MAQCMDALARQSTQTRNATHLYALHMATLFNNHPYCYLCRDGCGIMYSAMHVMECKCGISCLCTLSASAFIEPSLHQLDFFLFMETCFLIQIHCL